MGISKDVEDNRRVMNLCSCGHFVNRQTGNTVHKDMIFVAPIEFIFFSSVRLEAV